MAEANYVAALLCLWQFEIRMKIINYSDECKPYAQFMELYVEVHRAPTSGNRELQALWLRQCLIGRRQQLPVLASYIEARSF
jgi:hypothetical protein